MPRSRTWAAAARPTGPPPRIATVLVLVSVIAVLRFCWNYRNRSEKNSGSLVRQDSRRAGSVRAAFLDQVIDQAAHQCVVGVAHQGRPLARLSDEADGDQRLEVMRQRRGRDVDLGLQPADRQSLLPYPHEEPVDLQAGRVAQRFEAGG